MDKLTDLNTKIEALHERLRLTSSIDTQITILRELRGIIQERYLLEKI